MLEITFLGPMKAERLELLGHTKTPIANCKSAKLSLKPNLTNGQKNKNSSINNSYSISWFPTTVISKRFGKKLASKPKRLIIYKDNIDNGDNIDSGDNIDTNNFSKIMKNGNK
jgi:hypothetical protein